MPTSATPGGAWALPALWHNAFTSHWATPQHAVEPSLHEVLLTVPPRGAEPWTALANLGRLGLRALLGAHDGSVVPDSLPLRWPGRWCRWPCWLSPPGYQADQAAQRFGWARTPPIPQRTQGSAPTWCWLARSPGVEAREAGAY